LVVSAAVLLLACQRQPRGKYLSHVKLPTGQEWTEQADFRPNGTCNFGHPPDYVADCKWTRNGRIITISRNGVVLTELKFDGKNLVLAEDDTFHSPFVPQD
jgi:hypothetical protein